VVICFLTADLLELCSNGVKAKRRTGPNVAEKLRKRLDDLAAAPTMADCRKLPGRCHELKGDRDGVLAIDLGSGRRLLFRPAHDVVPRKPDGGLDWFGVTRVTIVAVEDYHE
jgi:plasmid maintenance system killer protein